MNRKPEKPEMRTIIFPDGTSLSVSLMRKPIKNLYLRLRRDGTASVSAPLSMGDTHIDAFVRSKEKYIRTFLQKLSEQRTSVQEPMNYTDGEQVQYLGKNVSLKTERSNVNCVKLYGDTLVLLLKNPGDRTQRGRLFAAWQQQESRCVFNAALKNACAEFSVYYPGIPEMKIRVMKSRWGSCHVRQNRITLNRRLLEAPPACIRMVIFHELCHFLHPDHSRNFYSLLEQFCPDWKDTKRLLEDTVIL
ncbi:MAG: M48 family metallopeptidase [Ruminococcus sp.]|nr:M48 family metallopeptidase [Ruminococcus sp.]